MKAALEASLRARNHITAVDDAARRAKESQRLAREAEDEAKEVTETAMAMQKDYEKWFGLGIWFSDF